MHIQVKTFPYKGQGQVPIGDIKIVKETDCHQNLQKYTFFHN